MIYSNGDRNITVDVSARRTGKTHRLMEDMKEWIEMGKNTPKLS